ncbi:DPEP2 neighbor protein [Erethizon dorsatum]
MSDQIIYLQANLSSVPWEGSAAAAVLPTTSPTPVYYHVLYQGYGETQVSWHGETYCLVGGYRTYGDTAIATPAKSTAAKLALRWVCGDASIVTPAKAETQKPAFTRALKMPRFMEEYKQNLGGPSPKIRHMNNAHKTQQ